MTDTEKLIVSRLIMAVDAYRKPQRFTVPLSPAPFEFDRLLEAAERDRQAAASDLDAALAKAKTIAL
jgi:hypothetical protein